MATSSHTAALQPTGPREEGEVPSLAPLRSDQTQEIPRTDVPAAPLVHELSTLIAQAPTLFAPEQAEMVGHINARFDEIAARGGSRATADFILGQLDRGGLGELVDANGRTARSAAVGALLQLGYPYALEVRPEDLEHFRGSPQGRRPIDWVNILLRVLALTIGAGALWLLRMFYSPAELLRSWRWFAPMGALGIWAIGAGLFSRSRAQPLLAFLANLGAWSGLAWIVLTHFAG